MEIVDLILSIVLPLIVAPFILYGSGRVAGLVFVLTLLFVIAYFLIRNEYVDVKSIVWLVFSLIKGED